MIDIDILKKQVLGYFNLFDDTINALSNKQEDKFMRFPSYFYKYKNITIGFTEKRISYIIKAIPDDCISANIINHQLLDKTSVQHFVKGMESNVDLDMIPSGFSIQHGDIIAYGEQTINSEPVYHFEGFVITISESIILSHFTVENA